MAALLTPVFRLIPYHLNWIKIRWEDRLLRWDRFHAQQALLASMAWCTILHELTLAILLLN